VRRLSHQQSNQTTPTAPNIRLLAVTAKSLFLNILRLNYLFSIFYGRPPLLQNSKLNKTGGLSHESSEIQFRTYERKSLFRNILRVKSLESIFCAENMGSLPANSFKNNILPDSIEK
jgi:hypothetical protein